MKILLDVKSSNKLTSGILIKFLTNGEFEDFCREQIEDEGGDYDDELEISAIEVKE